MDPVEGRVVTTTTHTPGGRMTTISTPEDSDSLEGALFDAMDVVEQRNKVRA